MIASAIERRIESARLRAHYRSESGVRFQWIAEPVLVGEIDESCDEPLVDRIVHIDAPDATAGLARIEECAIHQVLNRMHEVRVRSHVGRVVAAQFQASADETVGRGTLNRMPALDRAGEGDEADARVANHALGVGVREVQNLHYSLGKAGLAEAGGELFRAQRRLGRMFQDHGVARHERRHDAVYGDQVWIVPRGDRQHDAERLATDEARETSLWPNIDIALAPRLRHRSCSGRARVCREPHRVPR